MDEMSKIDIQKVVKQLCTDVGNKKKKDLVSLTFDEFLELASAEPERVFRNIFQLFHDAVRHYVKEEKDEHPGPESIGFVPVNCDDLLVNGVDNPFFAGRLFANRFLKSVDSLRNGARQNKINILVGPHGCGKSTFLNNLLKKFEVYVNSELGRCYEIFWQINKETVNPNSRGTIEVSCPSHCHPITVIPKEEREDFLEKILKNSEIRYLISSDKQYEWVFEDKLCTVCQSLFDALFEKFGDIEKVFSMIKIKSYKFNRRLGQGISVFNPGDMQPKDNVLFNTKLQKQIEKFFSDSQLVRYVFSRFARTNNGIYVLADIKSHNIGRLVELHNIISEGVHRVGGDIEEGVNSIFFALANPGDEDNVKEKVTNFESFRDRIFYTEMPYLLDVETEVRMYKSIFGDQISFRFLPRILDNFARIVISTRMKEKSKALSVWIKDLGKYKNYCDKAGRLLRMEIAGGNIPKWISKEDKDAFKKSLRKKLIDELDKEGQNGFSGRESIQLLGEMLAHFKQEKIIDMNDLIEFFGKKIGERKKKIPFGFQDNLLTWYDNIILDEIEVALFDFNEDRIDKDIKQYMFAVNCDLDTKHYCPYTNEEIKVTEDFLRSVESRFFQGKIDDKARVDFRNEIMKIYTSDTYSQEISVQGKDITETDLYKNLYETYTLNLKENVLAPLYENDNFRRAILDFFEKDKFKTYDKRIRKDVTRVIKKLCEEFNYTEQGAKDICIYAIENAL